MLFLALSSRDDPSWDSLVACLRMKNYLFVGIRSAGAIHDLGNSQMAFHHQQTSNLLNRFPIKFIAKFFCRSQRNIKIKVDGLLLLVFIDSHWILLKNKGNSRTCCSRFHGHFCHSSKNMFSCFTNHQTVVLPTSGFSFCWWAQKTRSFYILLRAIKGPNSMTLIMQ